MNIKDVKSQSRSLTNNQEGIFSMIEERREKIDKILPSTSNTNAFINQAILSISTNPKLMQCKPESILKALMECASYGLEPNGSLSEAALVPYGDTVEFLIEYRGLMKLAWNSNLVQSIHFDKICSNDDYTYKVGKEIEFSHSPNLMDRGEAIAYYSTAQLVNGGFVIHIMTVKEIITHGSKYSKSYAHKTSPWKTDFDAMAYKTVIRQLCDKKLPKNTQNSDARLLYRASHLDDHPEEKRDDLVKSMEIEAEKISEEFNGVPVEDFTEVAKKLANSLVKKGMPIEDVKEQLFNICGYNEINDNMPSDKHDSVIDMLNKSLDELDNN